MLRNIETYLNHRDKTQTPIGQRFDFIAGTSVGGLIALALATGKSAAELEPLLKKTINSIFGSNNRNSFVTRLWRPKYKKNALTNALLEVLGEKTGSDVVTDFCITSVSLQNARPRLHKSDYFARNVGRLNERLLDIALSTSAAPTYFPAHSSPSSTDLVDGALVANNPALIALVDAYNFERKSKRGISAPTRSNDADDVAMLSIGTGEQCGMPYKVADLRNGGIFNWAKPIWEVMMQAQSEAVHHQAHFLLGERYLRINPLLKFPMKLDGIEQVGDLLNLADIDKKTENFLNEFF